MENKTRRRFLSDNFSTIASFGVGAAFSALGGRIAHGEASSSAGSLVPINDETTGLPLLRLPEGFRYRTYGWSNERMSDGTPTPKAHDGMGVVRSEGDVLTLVRNHESSSDKGHIKLQGEVYDQRAGGGCTTLQFDVAKGEWISSAASLSGTSRNCAGGVTPWGTWLTCEETVLGPGDADRYQKKVAAFSKSHGWIFEVPADGVGIAEPLKDMGRFVHEAVAVDRETGIVYETEDRKTSGFYRFVPNEKGKLSRGGKLQIAEVVGFDDLRTGVDAVKQYDVKWHTIPNPRLGSTPGDGPPDELGVFKQGKKLKGTTFARLEGCWYGSGLIYFDATSGGDKKAGQIWQYDPKSETLRLLFESPDKSVLNMPDNLCVSPRGGIVLCEDNDYGVEDYPQRMFGLSQEGRLRLLAQNNVVLDGEKDGLKGDFRDKEWAGATFSPDGKWLFVNIQTPGFTAAITGPWESTLV